MRRRSRRRRNRRRRIVKDRMRLKRSRRSWNRRKMRKRGKTRKKVGRMHRIYPEVETKQGCWKAGALEEVSDGVYIGIALGTDV